ncbi:MAG: Sepiapterin reductase [Candidatus Heimdallarchaeota archaeon LC_2]|nr:MAG: Sepiapterin reductase [Candidatus Heimdallarchaeota archaeon LC_2]OLS21492.1 MAG: Sepiapterin reductase [Candidatus Heimdallarchaeota archaeon LC_2]
MNEKLGFKVLITGGSSGVGEHLALRLAQNSNNQIYITGRNIERLNDVVMKISDLGARGYFQTADVASSHEAEEVVEDAIKQMGGLDIFIANSGVGRFKLLEEMTDEDIDEQFNTNVKGVYNFLRPIVVHMKSQDHGQIIVTSSNLGINFIAKGSVYCATKFAVQAIVGSLREELKGTSIKAATVNPGAIDTPWFVDYGEEIIKNRLDVEEVVDAFMFIINQGDRSNIDMIHLVPTYRLSEA